MPYKSINLLGITFKIAEKKSWIDFVVSEIQDFIKKYKISKDDLIKSHEIDGTSERKEIVKKEKIYALNRIEILGYSSEIMDSLKSMKSVKDIKKLREKFQGLVKSNKELADILFENADLERSKILADYKEIEIRKISDNSPVFNFKRLLKFFLETKLGDQSKKLVWKVAKSKK